MTTTPDSGQHSQRFRSIYELHSSTVTAYALRRAGASDAADLVSETFLTVWRRLDDVPPEPETRAWILAVARRVAANQTRGERRRTELGRKLSSRFVDRFYEQPPIERLDERSTLARALRRLSDDDRELLLLIAWDGMTPSEVATVMGVPAGTVRKRLFRARKRLVRHRQRIELERNGRRHRHPATERSMYRAEGALG